MKHAAPVQPPLGDMIFNPGGPGGSGVGMVLGYERWRPILGQRYGLIGMDPRSVNNSGPNVDHLIDKAALHNEYAAEMSFKYHSNSPGAVKKTRGENPDEAKLKFFGVSYGSILGTTFAQLFPNRVRRMITDGVMDPSDYYDGACTKSVTQGDDAVHAFACQCFDARIKCAFFTDDSSPEAILQRLDTILQDLGDQLIGVSDLCSFDFLDVVNHMDLLSLIMLST
ncbi:hypothetical protein N0V87_007998 [Didymella glomerata]|uniref:AB hydrolase-1 domain-containing protein n=1 Tax=Didymella glomerata TaxID=749621 RepID=A0A9W9BX28_9PLEO|nr:hypothetical protein N0V87_007998 [Didymella glomerata]